MKKYLYAPNNIVEQLSTNDPVMKKIIDLCGVTKVELHSNHFESLVNSIVLVKQNCNSTVQNN